MKVARIVVALSLLVGMVQVVEAAGYKKKKAAKKTASGQQMSKAARGEPATAAEIGCNDPDGCVNAAIKALRDRDATSAYQLMYRPSDKGDYFAAQSSNSQKNSPARYRLTRMVRQGLASAYPGISSAQIADLLQNNPVWEIFAYLSIQIGHVAPKTIMSGKRIAISAGSILDSDDMDKVMNATVSPKTKAAMDALGSSGEAISVME